MLNGHRLIERGRTTCSGDSDSVCLKQAGRKPFDNLYSLAQHSDS